MSRNHLSEETSPYLLQHKDNPVHWHPWGPEALDRARAEGKPILLSVGYSSCHWCHVMAHESFEDPDVAALMNDLFINIKVDREERPDLDTVYQSALALMGEQGGWPLTMFLTPDGAPFWGGTYFPPEPRWGRPGFPDLLTVVAQAWREQAHQIAITTRDITHSLERLSHPAGGTKITPESFERAAALSLRTIDTIQGGTLGAPKFPQPPLFRFLWHAARRLGTPLYADPVTTTLRHMCQGGIYDHLGGGFARYSTDEVWLVPHFEKMLYDNALLVELMCDVWKEARDPLLATRIEETLGWLLRDMRVEGEGGTFALAGALDADSEGEEGRYYVWTEDEIDALLGSASPVFKESYDVTRRGNWEGRTILNRSKGRDFGMPALEAKLAEHRATLLAAREARTPPLRDDKVLTDWNAMAISALARAGALFDRPEWLEAARAIWTFLATHLRDDDGRLRHAWRAGRAGPVAVADDYAQLARAALFLYEATGATPYLDAARDLVAEADHHHLDPENGGYFLSSSDAEDVFVRTKAASDSAVPAANAVMAEVLARLFHLTGDPDWHQRAERLLLLFGHPDPAGLIQAPSLLTAYDLLEGGLVITLSGPLDDPGRNALARVALEHAPPAAVLAHDTETEAVSATLCRNGTCSLPINDPQLLRRDLDALRGDRFGFAPDSAPQRAASGSRA